MRASWIAYSPPFLGGFLEGSWGFLGGFLGVSGGIPCPRLVQGLHNPLPNPLVQGFCANSCNNIQYHINTRSGLEPGHSLTTRHNRATPTRQRSHTTKRAAPKIGPTGQRGRTDNWARPLGGPLGDPLGGP